MQGAAELLRGIAAILWPLTAIVALVLFRTEIRSLVNRIRKARVSGVEVELDVLQQRTAFVQDVVPALTADTSDANQSSPSLAPTSAADDTVETILKAAAEK